VLNSVRNKLLRELAAKPRGINEKDFRLLVDATKKMAQTLIGILSEEGVIEKIKFYLYITDKGKTMLNE
jgi:predicted transcriptional regulator